LWNAKPQQDPSTVPVVTGVTGNTLTLDTPVNYAGLFQVSVSVTDQMATSAPRTFVVYVTNVAPTLDPIADRHVTHTVHHVDVPLGPHDTDNDALSYNVALQKYTTLVDLNTTFHFITGFDSNRKRL